MAVNLTNCQKPLVVCVGYNILFHLSKSNKQFFSVICWPTCTCIRRSQRQRLDCRPTGYALSAYFQQYPTTKSAHIHTSHSTATTTESNVYTSASGIANGSKYGRSECSDGQPHDGKRHSVPADVSATKYGRFDARRWFGWTQRWLR